MSTITPKDLRNLDRIAGNDFRLVGQRKPVWRHQERTYGPVQTISTAVMDRYIANGWVAITGISIPMLTDLGSDLLEG